MKRCHESTIDGIPWPQPENTENMPNQVFKKRRMVHSDSWSGLCRRRSLRDINNLSEHPASIPHDEKTTLKVTQSRVQRTTVIESGKEVTPESVHTGANIPSHGSCSQHQATLTNSHPLPTSVPDRQASVSGPASSSSKISRVAATHPLPRFASHENSVRITQSRTSQQTRPSGSSPNLDSDQDDDSDNGSDEESDNEPGPDLGIQIDSDEKQRVENNYSEMNKLLGNLFLSRHRNRS